MRHGYKNKLTSDSFPKSRSLKCRFAIYESYFCSFSPCTSPVFLFEFFLLLHLLHHQIQTSPHHHRHHHRRHHPCLGQQQHQQVRTDREAFWFQEDYVIKNHIITVARNVVLHFFLILILYQILLLQSCRAQLLLADHLIFEKNFWPLSKWNCLITLHAVRNFNHHLSLLLLMHFLYIWLRVQQSLMPLPIKNFDESLCRFP